MELSAQQTGLFGTDKYGKKIRLRSAYGATSRRKGLKARKEERLRKNFIDRIIVDRIISERV